MKLTILLASVFSVSLFADSFFVETPKLIGADEKLQKVVRELIVQSLEENNHSIVSGPKKADFVITSTVMKLEKSYLFKVKKQDGKKFVSRKMKTKTLDDIDVTISRVVSAIVKEKTVKQTRKVEQITQDEQEKSQRKLKVSQQRVFGIGPAFLSNMDQDNAIFFTAGYLWGLDTHFDLFVRGDYSNAEGGSSAGMMNLHIGGNYFVTEDIHAPYITGSFGYGKGKSDFKSKDGWTVSGGAGMKFFRASTINFGVEARYTMLTKDLFYQAGAKQGKPGQLTLSIVLFI